MLRPGGVSVPAERRIAGQWQLTLVGGGVLLLVGTNPLEEATRTPLLEETHQRRAQSLASVRGDLGNGGLGALALLDEAASNLLELEVSGNIGRDEDVGELAVRHEQLGHKVDVPVVDAAVLLPRLLALGVVAVLLEHLLGVSIQRGCGVRDAGTYRLNVQGRSLTASCQYVCCYTGSGMPAHPP